MHSTIFKDPDARARMETWYSRVRASIPAVTTTRSVTTDYGDTHILSAGPEDGPPVIALHGALANSALLLRELTPLLGRFRVHAVDVIGQSVMGADAALPVKGDAHGRWLAAVLDQLGVERAGILGVSWGGFVATRFAAHAPGRVLRLALMVPAGIVQGKVLAGVFKLGLPMARFRRSPTAANRSRFLANLLTTTDDDWSEYLGDAFQCYRMSMTTPPLARPEELASLGAPVLVVAADQDYCFPGDRLLARARALFPTLVHDELLAGVKHSPPTSGEFRARMGATLAAFFAGELDGR